MKSKKSMKEDAITKSWVHKLALFVTSFPKQCLLITSIFCALFLPGLLDFKEKHDVRIWFRDNDPNLVRLNEFERKFGNDENIVLIINSPNGIFDKASVNTIKEISEKMWEVDEVLRVDSLSNFFQTKGSDDEVITSAFIEDDDQLTKSFLEAKRKEALEHRVLPGYLISKDAKSAMIFARLVPTLNGSPNYRRIVAQTRELVDRYESIDDHRIYLTGEATVNDAFREVSNSDNLVILPILFLFVMISLIYIFRSLAGMVIPIVVAVISILMTFGLCFYLGMTFDSILSVVPGILLSISIADAVHLMVTYFQKLAAGKSRIEATRLTLEKNIVPTLLTSISTMIGFFSLAYTDLMPIRQLGILAGIGCFFAWVITVFMIAPLLSLLNLKIPKIFYKTPKDEQASAFAKSCVRVIKKYKRVIVLGSLIITVMSIFFASRIEINSNPYLYFSKNIPVRQANFFVKDHFGGNAGPEIIIKTGVKDGIKNPVFLKKVEIFKNWLDGKEYVNKTIDIIDIIKKMNQVLSGGDFSEYKIPNNQRAIAEQLLLYTMGLPQGMDLNNRMSLDYESMRMSVLWGLFDTRSWLRHTKELEDKADELGLKIETTGKFLLFQRMMDYIVLTFFTSITSAMILVALLMMFFFKSVKIGLISMIPNLLPLFFGAMFMKLVGIELNIGSSLVASVCLGIAVDDTIHFISNYAKLKEEGHSLDYIFGHIFTYTGKALILTTIILVGGFGLFIFGDFVPNIHFGVLCAFILGTALTVDLIVLPAILMMINKDN